MDPFSGGRVPRGESSIHRYLQGKLHLLHTSVVSGKLKISAQNACLDCITTTFFNEFLNSPHESATYVHNEFFVIRYSNLLPFVTHVVVFFVFFTHTKHKLRAGRGFVFSGLHTLQLVSLCGVRRPLLCLCVSTSVVGCVFRFLHVVQNMSPSWQFYISRRGWFESGTRAGSRLVFTLGKKKMAAREVEGQG